MKTKLCQLFLVVILTATSSFAVEVEKRQVSIAAGTSKSYELGFIPSGYNQQTGGQFVSVVLPQGASSVQLTAKGRGGESSVIQFSEEMGPGVLLTVNIQGGGDLDKLARALNLRLSSSAIDGLEVSKGSNTLIVEGSISNPSDWKKFEDICKLQDFRGRIESLVEFSVDPATIGALRRELIEEGLNLADVGARPKEGQISLRYQHNILSLDGVVYSSKDIDTVNRVLKRQSWLEIVKEPKNASTAMIAQAVVNLDVDDSLLELGVAFVVVSKSEATKLESDYDLALKGVWGGISDFLFGGSGARQHGKWNDFTINAGLSSSLSMLAENKVSRERQYGTIRFHANGDPGKTLHIGGTLKVMPDASGDGPAPEAQDFEYGFKIVNRNSHRINADMAEADIEIEIKGEPYSSDLILGKNSNVRQETRRDYPTVRVPLGKTVAVAGYEHLVETTVPPSGIPLLRHIPILSWFTSSRGESSKDYALLFLVSIRQVDVESEAPMVENTPMKDITLDANRPNQERIDEEAEKKKKFHGCWTPLNWFTW